MKKIILSVNDNILTAKPESNSSAYALMKMLEDGPLSIKMSDYGNMEKVGDIKIPAILNDTVAAQDFMTRLPFSVSGTEE